MMLREYAWNNSCLRELCNENYGLMCQGGPIEALGTTTRDEDNERDSRSQTGLLGPTRQSRRQLDFWATGSSSVHAEPMVSCCGQRFRRGCQIRAQRCPPR